jgi:DNA-binding response OmpR family regulator
VQPDPQLAPRVLLSLNDVLLRRTLDTLLRARGFSVRATTEPVAVEVLLRSYEPEVAVVDVMLMGPDGVPVYRRVRRHSDLYLIVYGAEDRDRSTLLRSGADDAVDLATDPDEIAARCEALLRRPRRLRTQWEPLEASIVRLGPLVVDLGRREVRVRAQEVALTRLEFDLLAQLCRRPHEVSTRTVLLEEVWGPGWVGDSHVVDVHLSNLRRKLRSRANDLRFIHTVRGVGFRLSDDVLELAAEDLADRSGEMIRPA